MFVAAIDGAHACKDICQAVIFYAECIMDSSDKQGRKVIAILDTLHDFIKPRKTSKKPIPDSQKALLRTKNKLIKDAVLNTTRQDFDMEKEYINKHQGLRNIIDEIQNGNTNFESDVLKFVQVEKKVPTMQIPVSDPNFTSECKRFFNTSKIVFVVDVPGKLTENTLCTGSLQYKGLFDSFDAANKRSTNPSCIKNEFQSYSLKKSENILLEYDSINAELNSLTLNKDGNVHNYTSKKGTGVTQLRDAIYAVKKVNHDIPSVTEAKKEIDGTYGIPSNLDQVTYIRTLYDIKRSGDYLTIEAVIEANKNSTDGTLYVLVTIDKMGVAYADFRNVPSVHSPVGTNGFMVTLHDPRRTTETNVVHEPISESVRLQNSESIQINSDKVRDIYQKLKEKGKHLKTVLRESGVPFNLDTLNVLSNTANIHKETEIEKRLRRALTQSRQQSRVNGGKVDMKSLKYEAASRKALSKTLPTTTWMESLDLADPLYELLVFINKLGETELSVFDYLVFRFITFPPKDAEDIVRPYDTRKSSSASSSSRRKLQTRPSTLL
jgi:hypothetical protein